VDKFVLLFRSLIASIVVGLAVYFVGYHNLTAFIVMAVIQGLVLGFTIFCISMFAPDMVEYGRYITGIPASGISLSLQTFSSKLSMAIATSLGALCLSLIGFAEGEGAVQIEGFNDKLWFIYCIIPVIATAIALPLFSRYKLRDATVAIMVQANNGEMSKEEADKLLEGKI
jgi:Na+/melibiose symporter-like transporter